MRDAALTCSPYLRRRVRTLEEVLAQRREDHARLAEIHACLDRAETESHKIADGHSLCSGVSTTFNELAEAIGETRQDYLKPAEEELTWAEEDEG